MNATALKPVIADVERARSEIATVSDLGELQRLSVSTIKKFLECERRFYFAKVLHLPEPQYAAQQLGTEGHAQNEHYVKTGEDVLGDIARKGKHLLPEPGPGLLAEERFEWTVGGVPISGFVDLTNLRRLSEGVIRITDYKFVKSVDAAWAAQRPSDLTDASHEQGHGIQMIGYAVAHSIRWPTAGTFELEHIQYPTKVKKHQPRSIVGVVTRDEAFREWAKVEAIVPRIREVARAKDFREAKPSWDKCARCPFVAHCTDRPRSLLALPSLRSTSPDKEQKPMGIMARLQTAQNSAAPATPAAPPPPAAPPAQVTSFAKPAVPAPAPAKRLIIDESTVPDARLQGAIEAKDAVQGSTYVLPSGKLGTFNCNTPQGASFIVAVGQPPELLAPNARILPPLNPRPTIVEPKPEPQAPAAAQVVAEVNQAIEQTVTKAEEKTSTRKRRTKAEIEADERAEAQRLAEKYGLLKTIPENAPPAPSIAEGGASVTVVPVAVPVSSTEIVPVTVEEAATLNRIEDRTLRVFVDAIPNGGQVLSLAEYVAEKKALLEQEFQTTDIRCAPRKYTGADGIQRENPLAFAGWKGALASVIREQPPTPGTYVLIARESELLQVVAEALEAVCAPGNFVRGVR